MTRSAHHGAAVDSQPSWPPSVTEVEAARQGDREAMGRILATGFPKIVAFYRGMGLRSAESEEIASEAIEGMVLGFARLRESGAFEAWFWTVARNRVRSRLRVRGRVLYERDYIAAEDPGDLAVTREEHAVIRQAMEALSTRDREILWLREVEELEYDEIAGRMRIAAGAARVAALRARRRLETEYARLSPQLDHEPPDRPARVIQG